MMRAGWSWFGSWRSRVAMVALLALASLMTVSAARVKADAPPRPKAAYGESRLHVTWREPFGMPRATDRIEPTCDDTSNVDTLFISFDVTRVTPGLESLGVVVYFHPQGGDTLGSFWHFKRGWENEMNLLVDFDVVAGVAGELPWQVMGLGTVTYDHRSGRGRLDLGFRVPKIAARPLEPGKTYTAARIRIQHKRFGLAGCRQAVCVEGSDLQLKLATGRRIPAGSSGNRFAGWHSPDGPSCRPRAGAAVRPWRPK